LWQGLYRLAVEVFWALGDATEKSGGNTGRSVQRDKCSGPLV
jgi:hypothetical protein